VGTLSLCRIRYEELGENSLMQYGKWSDPLK
jgi:hypothetical protein